jgi:hypothetical protein
MPASQESPSRSYRRQALQIVMQLPLEPDAALAILDEARALVGWVERPERKCLRAGECVVDTSGEVVPLIRTL